MSLENIRKALEKPKYFLAFLVTAVFVGFLYMGLLTDPALYGAIGWVFACLFPLLVGLIVAMQWYNLAERKSCSTPAAGGGIFGGIAGIITAACPACPSVLLSLLGLGGGVAGGILGGPWIKLGSLAVLMWSLYQAVK